MQLTGLITVSQIPGQKIYPLGEHRRKTAWRTCKLSAHTQKTIGAKASDGGAQREGP